jgi:hypothetical protein
MSSNEMITSVIMEGISSMVDVPNTPSSNIIINHISDYSYIELLDYMKLLFNDSIKKDINQGMIFLDQIAIQLWGLYKNTTDKLNILLNNFPDSAIIEDANIKQTIQSMFNTGLDDHTIIEKLVNDNKDNMKLIVSSIGIDKTSDYIEHCILSEKTNNLLHRIKDTLLPSIKNNLMIK